MWNSLLDHLLKTLFSSGTLTLQYPDGSRKTYGDGTAPLIGVHLHTADLPRKIVRNPDLAVGEAYMEGTLTIAGDNLYGFIGLVLNNLAAGNQIWWQQPARLMRRSLRRIKQFNPIGKAQQNVAHHYDLSGQLYDLFLDQDKQYSCAYFRDASDTLEQAQIQKKNHIAAKLCLKPGQRVLDIGCGWGGMALTLARDHGVRVLGVTLSKAQYKIAQERVVDAGLSHQVEIQLIDYRRVRGQFDRIVSVGMFEHVGVPHFREYFRHLRSLLAPDGVALVHTIGRSIPPGTTSTWIDKYIFPGGYIPALSETMRAVEKEALLAVDIEVWRLHYAETLKHWYDRFMARQHEAEALYDKRFCRMWRYYLVASELTFRLHHQVVFQVQLTRKQDAVPLTRDYLYADAKETRQRAAQ